MDPNQSDEEPNNWSDIDDETDLYFMMATYEYQQQLEKEAARPRVTHNRIYREREVSEERFMSKHFTLLTMRRLPLIFDLNACSSKTTIILFRDCHSSLVFYFRI